MKKLIPTMLVAIACIAFSDCNNSPKKEKEVIPDTKKVVEDKPVADAISGTYSISAPDGWKKKDTLVAGVKRTSITSPDDGSNDRFKENVNVNTEEAKDYDLKAYAEANRANMVNQFTGMEFLSEGETTIGDMPSKWYIYSFDYSGYQLKNTAYFFVYNDRGYVITCTALKTTFDRFQSDFKTCVNSFKINK